MKKEFIIWGAGHYGILTALDLKNKGFKVKCFIDTNASKIKTIIGLPVFEPNEIISEKKQNPQIIIAVQNENAIKEITKILKLNGLNKNKDFKISSLINDIKNEKKLQLKIKFIQNSYDLSELKKSKSVVLFLIPPTEAINGGIMMIFAFAKYSRILNKEAFIAVSTYPGKDTYANNTLFPNEEKIYRFEQITDNCKCTENLILNIPEYMACNFYGMLNDKEIAFLKNVKKLQINIMNQNILLMPSPKKLESLKMLTKNITQTTGFKKYTTQQICNKWSYPLYFLQPHPNNGIDYSVFKKAFSQKNNIIYFSPDQHPRKSEILNHLKEQFPNFSFVEIRNLKYTNFLKFAADCKFAITFGEGYDGYIFDIHRVGGIGFAVYNQDFFSSKKYLDFTNIFQSWDDLKYNVYKTINFLLNNLQEYDKCSSVFLNELNKFCKEENTINCLKDFYNHKPTFVPKIKKTIPNEKN